MFSNIPTDNLYKFMALFGLAIFLFAIYFSFTQQQQLSDKIHIFLLEFETLSVESKITDELLSNYNELQNPTPEDYKEIKKVIYDMHRRKAVFDENKRMVNELRDYRKFNRYYEVALLIIGSVLITIGFSLWYDRLQYYQDIEIRNNARQKVINTPPT